MPLMKEMELQENGSIKSENEHKSLIIDIEAMVESVELPLVSHCCIYKVPQKIRKLNEQVYTPSIVSIGPFHNGDKRLESMEDLKLRYVKSFLERTPKGLQDCIEYIKKSDVVIQRPFNKALPWFVLEDLFNLTEPSCLSGEDHDQVSSFIDVAFHYFRVNFLQSIFPSGANNTMFTLHYFHEHYKQYIMKPDEVSMQLQNLTDLLRIFYLPPDRLPRRRKETVKHLYNASQLVEAGVKLHVGEDKSILELQFTKGVFTIPRFEVCHWTEILIRNVVAFVQCHYPFQTYIRDYIILLDFLIDTSLDVDTLVDKGIMVNTLGDSSAVANMVNNLCINVVQENINSGYIRLCEKLNGFYEDPFHKYKASFIHDYFSSPWKITSFVAAILLLLLTLIQAICSVISLF
ncbi:unnamed protein product [Lupinus luteus]|uniref:Uncharacterized protein n=1 Tax=Lupinus luteus TaxID=3873 RepID=A0AAV1VYA7_LUPLU